MARFTTAFLTGIGRIATKNVAVILPWQICYQAWLICAVNIENFRLMLSIFYICLFSFAKTFIDSAMG